MIHRSVSNAYVDTNRMHDDHLTKVCDKRQNAKFTLSPHWREKNDSGHNLHCSNPYATDEKRQSREDHSSATIGSGEGIHPIEYIINKYLQVYTKKGKIGMMNEIICYYYFL